MSVKLEFDPQFIYKQIQSSTDVALYQIAERVINDTKPLVPKSPPKHKGSGTLRNSVEYTKKTKKDPIIISYSRPIETKNGEFDIAEEIHEGIHPKTGLPIRHWNTPGTGPFWVEKSIQDNYADWFNYFREETKRQWRNRKQKA